MASVTLRSSTTSEELSNVTSHTVSMPATVNAGDLLLLLFATDGDNTISNWNAGNVTGWIELCNNSHPTDAVSLSIAYKKAAGDEDSDTATVVTNQSEYSAHITMAWYNTADPATVPPEISSPTAGSSQNADPPTFGPSWGDDGVNYWLAICAQDANGTVNTYPFTENQLSEPNESNPGCLVASCGREDDIGTQNPIAYNLTDSDEWLAQTLCIANDEVVGPSDFVKDVIGQGIIPFAR